MKVMVEISDEQVIAVLQEAIRHSFSTSIPRYAPPRPFELENITASAEFCSAANRVIRYFGGVPVDLSAITPYPPISSTHQQAPK